MVTLTGSDTEPGNSELQLASFSEFKPLSFLFSKGTFFPALSMDFLVVIIAVI